MLFPVAKAPTLLLFAPHRCTRRGIAQASAGSLGFWVEGLRSSGALDMDFISMSSVEHQAVARPAAYFHCLCGGSSLHGVLQYRSRPGRSSFQTDSNHRVNVVMRQFRSGRYDVADKGLCPGMHELPDCRRLGVAAHRAGGVLDIFNWGHTGR